MIQENERRYRSLPLPSDENLERYAVDYSPENFTEEETGFLSPFFTNTDRPVYVVHHLPEEVIAALSSRYSRTTDSLRRVFLREYIGPIVYPEQQKSWQEKSEDEKAEALTTKASFLEAVDFLNRTGGVEKVVNIQRARKFFDRWLAEYGDDSIAELGGVHLFIEGLSNVAVKEIEDKRIGISPLEKSTRYVSFADRRPDGQYQYVIPGEIIGTDVQAPYVEAMDLLFDTYTTLLEPYLEYIKDLYPKADDETDVSFRGSRAAKRFDDLRDLLPFATQTNVALYGNGRAFEDLINRLMYHPLGEVRYWGQQICRELELVVPSFVRRPKTERGAEVQIYRTNLSRLKREMVQATLDIEGRYPAEAWVRLVSKTPDADIKVLSAFLFSAGRGQSLAKIYERVFSMEPGDRTKLLGRILNERKFGKDNPERAEVRFRKVPRAFENARYLFEVWARGGDYRDLHRHRQQTQERQAFTTDWGYDLEQEVMAYPYRGRIIEALKASEKAYRTISDTSFEAAQYAVAFSFIQHWYMHLTAREIYWIAELRTSPQGRPHYRKITQQIAQEAIGADPSIFQGMMVDWGDYSISRRESEKKIEAKKQKLGGG